MAIFWSSTALPVGYKPFFLKYFEPDYNMMNHLKIKKKIALSFAMVFALVMQIVAQTSGESVKTGHEVTAEGAWCWFADPRAIHHENPKKNINKSYIGYIDVHGNIKAMQYDFVKKQQVEILVRSWFQPDDHDNPTFLVLPDDRVMIFYSRHSDERCFYYRITQKPGDIATLGEEKRLETDHNTTYPSAFILADDPDHIYLCWRGIKWHPTIAKLSLPDKADEVKFAGGPYQMVQSTGARPYVKYTSNGKDKIYMAYTTGHPDNENPNYLYFSYVDISKMTLCDIKTKELSDIAIGPFQVNKTPEFIQRHPYTVVDSPSKRDWVWQVAIDKQGFPVIAFVRISVDKKSHEYYYGRWTGKDWQKTFLVNGGGHFHQTQNLEMCYSGGMAIDPDSTDVVYCSAPVEGSHGNVYEIIKLRLDAEGKIIEREEITRNSTHNNIRPYVLQSSQNSGLRLTWMHGNYYDWIVSRSRPGYPTGIHADFPGFQDTQKESHELIFEGQEFRGKLPDQFTVRVKIQLDSIAYKGDVLKIGELTYAIDSGSLKPEISYRGKKWVGQNKLATSDSWLRMERGPDGKWHTPEKIRQLDLVLVYDKGVCFTYINGLLDQQARVGKIQRKNITVSSPDHKLQAMSIYKGASVNGK